MMAKPPFAAVFSVNTVSWIVKKPVLKSAPPESSTNRQQHRTTRKKCFGTKFADITSAAGATVVTLIQSYAGLVRAWQFVQ